MEIVKDGASVRYYNSDKSRWWQLTDSKDRGRSLNLDLFIKPGGLTSHRVIGSYEHRDNLNRVIVAGVMLDVPHDEIYFARQADFTAFFYSTSTEGELSDGYYSGYSGNAEKVLTDLTDSKIIYMSPRSLPEKIDLKATGLAIASAFARLSFEPIQLVEPAKVETKEKPPKNESWIVGLLSRIRL